nr:putative calcineurin-like metallo-phosphoesterase superfamily protein [Tanacetum cinerariifolium]
MYPRALLHAPPPLTQPPSFPVSKVNGSIRLSMTSSSVRIVVVGDTHDDWSLLEDSKAIHLLK